MKIAYAETWHYEIALVLIENCSSYNERAPEYSGRK